MKHIYSYYDVLIQPNIYPEPVGRTIIEAMQSSILVITTGYDEVSPIIRNMVDGILIYPCNEEKLFQSIMYVINNKEIIEKIKINGKNRVNEICDPIIIITKQYLNIYKNICSK